MNAHTPRANDFTQPITTPRLVVTQIEMMLAHAMRLPDVFTLAQLHLVPGLFRDGVENHYRVLWDTAKTIAATQTMDVLFRNLEHAYTLLEVTIEARASNNPAELPDELRDKILSRDPNAPGLLFWIYHQINIPELSFHWGRDLLRDFCVERAVHDNLRRAVAGAGNAVMTNMPEFLQSLRDKHTEIQSLQNNPAAPGAPEGWYPKPMQKVSTGLPFLNYFLKGGHAGKETYGVLGAFGSGKTCLAMGIAAHGAIEQLKLHEAHPDYHPKEWYLFSYEATLEEMRVRLWSQMCLIDHCRLEDCPFDQLSTSARPETLQAYEKIVFADQVKHGGQIQGELERFREKQPFLNQNLWLFDMTGSDPNDPGRGAGLVQEIATLVQNDLRERSQVSGRPHQVGGVVIDYAGLACRRYLGADNMSYDMLRHKLSEFGNECKRLLAVPYDCPVWIFHQLSGEANKKKFTAKISHADAAESKSFAENLVFCFQMGTKEQDHDAFYLHCSKARRGAIGRHPLLRLDGPFFRIVAAEGLVEQGGRVVYSDEAKKTVTGATYDSVDNAPKPSIHNIKKLPDHLDGYGGALG